jgi:hypothetical protein
VTHKRKRGLCSQSDPRLTAIVRQTPRGSILTFLLLQITIASPDADAPIALTNPHTDYVKLLPAGVPLPTYYTDEERNLLFGTSLQDALDQKLRSLENEFDWLFECTRNIEWCQKYWWDEEDGTLVFEDWMLVDALYRSRALDLPRSGHAMVPCIDMANHASAMETVALYETDDEGRAVLQLRPEKPLTRGQEVTITYGDEKGACEMLFSYGFLEPHMSSAKVIFLDLDIPEDDPLRLAKKTVNKEAPGVRIFVNDDGESDWEGKYIWWSCVNEEDGLDFRVAQRNDGGRELEMLWKDERIDPSLLPKALSEDPRWDVFRLRATVLLQDRVQLQKSHIETSEEQFTDSRGQDGIRDVVWRTIGQLRRLESGLLSDIYRVLEEQVSYSLTQVLKILLTSSLQKTELLSSEVVKRYLELAQTDLNPGLPGQTIEDDFS